MPEADVLYSDVIFTRTKENKIETPASNVDTTYSEINILKSQSGFQQESSNRGSKVTERTTLLLLCVLLAAAVIGLGVVSFDHFQTKKNLQTTNKENEALRKNVSAEPCPSCETGWDQHGGRCYYFSSSKLTWNQSRGDCKGRGADLVQIDSEEEQWFLEYRVRRKMNEHYDRFWIGLTDAEVEGRWLWVDGSLLSTSLSFWNGNEPDNWTGENPAGENCANMGEKGGADKLKCWFDRTCDAPLRSVCEKAAESGRH